MQKKRKKSERAVPCKALGWKTFVRGGPIEMGKQEHTYQQLDLL